MGKDSKIEWTTHTFNPWWGCEKVSPSCEHCYAETWAKRCGQEVWGRGKPRRVFGEKHWNEPLKWNKLAAKQRVLNNGQVLRQCGTSETAGKPETRVVLFEGEDGFTGEMPPDEWESLKPFRPKVFCASMADVFEERPDLEPERLKLWRLIEQTPNLDWLLLTKRPENVMDSVPHEWVMNGLPANVWMGITVEDQSRANERLPILLSIPAKVRFLSCEPLLGPVSLEAMRLDPEDPLFLYWPLEGKHLRDGISEPMAHANAQRIHWVICGGESGPGARPMHPVWAMELRDECVSARVPFLFKQWGDWRHCDEMPSVEYANSIRRNCGHQNGPGNGYLRVGKKAAGRLLDGVEHNGFPKVEGRSE